MQLSPRLDTDAEMTSDVQAAEYTVTDEDTEDDVTNATDLTWLLTGADAGKFEYR